MKALIVAALAMTAITAQADVRSAMNSIKGQDFVAMIKHCNTVSNSPGSHPLTEQDRKVIASAVKTQLKDPESAKFSGITMVSLRDVCIATTPYKDLELNHSTRKWEVITKTYRDSKPIIKGLVNAKNSYGGYTGEQQFTIYENLKIQF